MEKIFDSVKKDNVGVQSFETGSIRDSEENKGSPYLMPYANVVEIKQNIKEHASDLYIYWDESFFDVYEKLNEIISKLSLIVQNEEEKTNLQKKVISKCFFLGTILFYKKYYPSYEHSNFYDVYSKIQRILSIHFANGAKKYSANNWRKGQYVSRYYNSACRHLWSIGEHEETEDHFAAFLWNILAIHVTIEDIRNGFLDKKFNDYPFIKKEIF